MAQRRMFSPQIVGSDAFLDMPVSSQALYFHLGMYADDDGFVNPRRIMRMIGASDDDLTILLAKKFALPFESGVLVIKHWRINNFIRKDRYLPTAYLNERSTLFVQENQSYSFNSENAIPIGQAHWKSLGDQRSTQDRIGKDRIGNINTGRASNEAGENLGTRRHTAEPTSLGELLKRTKL